MRIRYDLAMSEGTVPTGQGLIDFLNFAAERGLMNPNTAGGLRAASREVLSAVENADWGTLDLRTVDPEDFGARFERLRASKFKPESLLVYKSRFRNAIQMYFAYLESPSGWRYRPERPASTRRKPGQAASPRPAAVTTPTTQAGELPTPRATIIEYPFPLRRGLVVGLRLPADLTRPEAKRLAAFIDSLAIESALDAPGVESPGDED